MLTENLWLAHPVLVQLRRQLNEISQHIGSGQTLVSNIGQHAVKAVTELMEQGSGVIVAQQSRLALGKVVIVDNNRDYVLSVSRCVAALTTVLRHPSTSLLERASEVIVEEDSDDLVFALSIRLSHLVHLHIRVVGRDVRAKSKLETEQLVGAVEHGLDHALQAEVGLHLRLVQVVARLTDLLGHIAPVPRLQLFT